MPPSNSVDYAATSDGFVAYRTVGTGRTPRVSVNGVPTEYLAHGKPDAILASLGLDAEGIARTTRILLA